MESPPPLTPTPTALKGGLGQALTARGPTDKIRSGASGGLKPFQIAHRRATATSKVSQIAHGIAIGTLRIWPESLKATALEAQESGARAAAYGPGAWCSRTISKGVGRCSVSTG